MRTQVEQKGNKSEETEINKIKFKKSIWPSEITNIGQTC